MQTTLLGKQLEQSDAINPVMSDRFTEEDLPEVKCLKCEWQGSLLEAEKAARYRRFIWTDEDVPGIKFY